MESTEIQLTELVAEQKKFITKADEEFKTLGKSNTETLTALQAVKEQISNVQKQADAIDLKINEARFGGMAQEAKSVGEVFIESDEMKAEKGNGFLSLRSKDGRIRVPIQQLFPRKSLITTVGVGTGTSGVQMPFRLPGVTGLPIQELRIRDLMTVRTMTTGNSFDYVKMLTRASNASPQVEGTPKSESTFTWTSASDTVKTIAHFTNVSRQALDDIPWLQGTINGELMYGLKLKEEAEILTGDGTGQHLNGLIHQATAYDTTQNVTSDQRLDELRHAKLQARLIGLGTFAPDGIVLNPTDMAKIELIKSEEGGPNKGIYIIGDPKTGPAIKLVWGLPVVESDSMPAGNFLVGAFATAAELIDRMQAMIEISFEHNVNFTSNLATLLCEERLGMAVRRPNAFIYGTFV
jgi:HK97 family phage major capsid protein